MRMVLTSFCILRGGIHKKSHEHVWLSWFVGALLSEASGTVVNAWCLTPNLLLPTDGPQFHRTVKFNRLKRPLRACGQLAFVPWPRVWDGWRTLQKHSFMEVLFSILPKSIMQKTDVVPVRHTCAEAEDAKDPSCSRSRLTRHSRIKVTEKTTWRQAADRCDRWAWGNISGSGSPLVARSTGLQKASFRPVQEILGRFQWRAI